MSIGSVSHGCDDEAGTGLISDKQTERKALWSSALPGCERPISPRCVMGISRVEAET